MIKKCITIIVKQFLHKIRYFENENEKVSLDKRNIISNWSTIYVYFNISSAFHVIECSCKMGQILWHFPFSTYKTSMSKTFHFIFNEKKTKKKHIVSYDKSFFFYCILKLQSNVNLFICVNIYFHLIFYI